jgi:hypothetical protein
MVDTNENEKCISLRHLILNLMTKLRAVSVIKNVDGLQ